MNRIQRNGTFVWVFQKSKLSSSTSECLILSWGCIFLIVLAHWPYIRLLVKVRSEEKGWVSPLDPQSPDYYAQELENNKLLRPAVGSLC